MSGIKLKIGSSKPQQFLVFLDFFWNFLKYFFNAKSLYFNFEFLKSLSKYSSGEATRTATKTLICCSNSFQTAFSFFFLYDE